MARWVWEETKTNEQKDLVALADEIRGLSAMIAKIARRDLQQRLQHHRAGLTAIEHGVLRRLAQGVKTMADLSRLMAVRPPTLVYVIDGLVAKGLVRRGKDARDRRREPLALEKKGRKLLTRIPNMEADSILVRTLGRMPIHERQQLKTLLFEFASGLAESTGSKSELRTIAGGIRGAPQRKKRDAKGRSRWKD